MTASFVLGLFLQTAVAFTPDDTLSKKHFHDAIKELTAGGGQRLPAGAVAKFGIPYAHVDCASLSPDGTLIAVGQPGAVRLLNARTLKQVFRFDLGQELDSEFSFRNRTKQILQVRKTVFSPDGRYILGWIEKKAPKGEEFVTPRMYSPLAEPSLFRFAPEAEPEQILLVWKTETGELAWMKRYDGYGWNFGVKFFTDGTVFVEHGGHRFSQLDGDNGNDIGLLGWRWVNADGKYANGLQWRGREFPGDFGRWTVSVDNRLVAACRFVTPPGKVYSQPDGTVCLWRDGEKKPLLLQGDAGAEISSLAFSKDGKLLVSAQQAGKWNVPTNRWDGTMRVWDTADGKERWQSKVHGNAVFAFSADGKLLATAEADDEVGWKKVRIWDLATGRERWQTKVEGDMRAPEFSPDGRVLLCYCHVGFRPPDEHNEIVLFDAGTGQKRQTISVNEACSAFVPHTNKLLLYHRPIEWTPFQGAWTVRVEHEARIHEWDIAENKEICTWPHPVGAIKEFQVSPDGKLLVCRGDFLTAWDVSGRKMLNSGDVHRGGAALQFSPDGKWLASVDVHGWMAIREVRPGRTIAAPLGGPQFQILTAAFSDDSTTLASISNEGVVQVWELEKSEITREFTVPTRFSMGDFNVHKWYCKRSLLFDPRGKTLAVAQKDGAVALWDVASGKRFHLLQATKGSADNSCSMKFSPNGKAFAYCGDQGKLRLWDLDAGTEVFCINDCSPAFEFSADSRLFAWASGKTVHKRDLSSGKEWTFAGPKKEVRNLAFCADGETLAALDDGEDFTALNCWELRTGEPLPRVEIKGDFQALLLWVHAGNLAAGNYFARYYREEERTPCYGGQGITLRRSVLWKAPPPYKKIMSGALSRWFERDFSGLVFSPDGRLLVGESVAEGEQEQLVLVDVATGKALPRCPRLRQGGYANFTFSHDGRFVACAGQDGTIVVWDWRAAVGAKVALDPLRRLSKQELLSCWAALAGPEPLQAYRAIDMLSAVPADALPFLKQQLQPASNRKDKRARQLVQQLQRGGAAERRRAGEALEKMGAEVHPLLREALAGRPSADASAAIEKILSSPDAGKWSPGTLRGSRAVQVLEEIASAEAAALLESLAGGYSQAVQTQEAKAALSRLKRANK